MGRRWLLAMLTVASCAVFAPASAHAEIAFGPPTSFAVTGIFTKSVVVRDVTGDGHLDIVAGGGGSATSTNVISVLAGNSTGTFGMPQSYPTTTATGFPELRTAAADLDGDGDLDIAASNGINADVPQVGVLRNDGSGGFADRVDLQGGRNPQEVVIARLAGTDALDLATPNFNNNTVSIFTGDGAGAFAHGVNAITIGGITTAPEAIAAADLDRDGRTDLLVTSRSAGPKLRVLRQTAPGTFVVSAPFVVGSIPDRVTAPDLNGDGHLDVLVSNSSSGTFSVFYGDGAGNLAAQPSMPGGGPDPQPEQAVFRDLDGDGDGDLATAHSDSPGYVAVHEGDGSGGFAAPIVLMTPSSTTGLAVRDVNNDSRPDIVVTNAGARSVSVLLNTGPGRDPECSDERDNDGDGKVDFPSDPDCKDARDDFEDACSPKGPVSGAVDATVLPPVRNVSPPVAETLRGVNCDTVLPLERTLGLAPPP